MRFLLVTSELGYRFDTREIAEIYGRFIALADRKKNIYDQDLLALIPSNVAVAV